MKKMLCFDMDGTLADFYNVANWLDYLITEKPTPYIEAVPLYDMRELREVLEKFISVGWEVRIISWLAKNSSEYYKNIVRKAKRDWLKKYNFPASNIHLVAYGTTKADCVRRALGKEGYAILVDDDAKVRSTWHLGKTINPQETNLISELGELLVEKNEREEIR